MSKPKVKQQPQAAELKELKAHVKDLKDIIEQKSKYIDYLTEAVTQYQTADKNNKELFDKLNKDFSKVCIQYDQIRQVVSRSAVVLQLDNINPRVSAEITVNTYSE